MLSLPLRKPPGGRLFNTFLHGALLVLTGQATAMPVQAARESASASRVPRQIPVSETTGPAGGVPATGGPLVLEPVNIRGADLLGRIVQGDDLRIIADNPIEATLGATGVALQGERINIQRLTGMLRADGRGATGVHFNGSQTRLFLNGEGQVTGGATGIALFGSEPVVRQARPFRVSGAGSIGIRIDGHDARLNGASMGTASDGATAMSVSGNHNRVDLYDEEVECLPGRHGASSSEPAFAVARIGNQIVGGGVGLRLAGDYNTVRLQDIGAVTGKESRGILMEGNQNRLYGDGGYRLVSAGAVGLEARGSANRITLDSGSLRSRDPGTVGVRISGSRSRFTTHIGSYLAAGGGATGVHVDGEDSRISLGGRIVAGAGSTAVKLTGVLGESRGATAVNEQDGVIIARGIGSRAMSASGLGESSRPSLINRGRLEVSPGLMDDGRSATGPNFPDQPAHEIGVAMSAVAPLNTTSRDLLAATNEGIIVVAGAGAAMMASLPGAQVVNQGVIDLQAAGPRAGPLFGMVALNGATAVNDAGGVINIEADHGRAFHSDGISRLVNRGSVNFKGQPLPPASLQAGLSPARNGSLQDASGDAKKTVNLQPKDLAGRVLYAGDGKPDGNTHLLNKSNIENGTLQVRAMEQFTNEGSIRNIVLTALGNVDNMSGATMDLSQKTSSSASGTLNNSGVLRVSRWFDLTGTLTNRADGTLKLNGTGAIRYIRDGSFVNHGAIEADAPSFSSHRLAIYVAGPGTGGGVNTGTLKASGGYGVMTTSAPFLRTPRPARPPVAGREGVRSLFVNQGAIDFTAGKGLAPVALHVRQHSGHDLLNDRGGAITVRGSRAIAMRSDSDSQLVNRGTINLGEPGTTDTDMVAMVLGPRSTASAAIVNDEGGIINIHAKKSHAFKVSGKQGLLINHGEVNLLCGDTSCGLYRTPGTPSRDISDSPAYANFEFNPRLQPPVTGSPRARRDLQPLAGYVIGTRPGDRAGKLSGDRLDVSGVRIDTGFTAGSPARQADFRKVLQGKGAEGIEGIASLTAAWQAQAYRDADGDIGVRMLKQDYRHLVGGDASLFAVAAALERGYDGSALFRSLELPSTADIGQAMRQLSGAGLSRALMPLRMLEQRFDRGAGSVSEDGNGFGLRLTGFGQGQPAGRLGASSYDMVAASQRFDLNGQSRLTARYGFARIRAGASQTAGLNGHSQLFGLHHAQPLGTGLVLESELRYALHQAGSRRTLQYGDIRLRPRADQRQDRFDGQMHLAFPVHAGGLKLEPLLGLGFSHRRDAALTERDAGVYALRLSASRDRALDGVFGLRLGYEDLNRREDRGWRADAQLVVRPTLFRQRSDRQAHFASMPDGGRFMLAADGGGIGYDNRIRFSHLGRHSRFELSGYLSRDGGIGDRGVEAKYLYRF